MGVEGMTLGGKKGKKAKKGGIELSCLPAREKGPSAQRTCLEGRGRKSAKREKNV